MSADRLSLRARLLTGVALVAAVCLVVVGVVVYVQQRDFLLDRVDEQLAAAPALVGRLAGGERPFRPFGGRFAPGPGGGRRGDGPPPGAAASLPPGVYLERRSSPSGEALGAVVLGFGDDAPSPPDVPATVEVGETVTVPAQDGSLDYRLRAVSGPGGGAIVVVAIPLSGVDEQLDELLLVEVVVIGGGLLLILALGWWVVRVALRPLDEMGETAGRIAAGDLSQRVEPADERTEIGRLGASLNAMLHQIEEAFDERARSEERLRRFLADASHELRTPLASIRGYAELYRMGAARDEEAAARAMSRIEQEAARMGVLVEDLLALARLDEVRDEVREPVDVGELVRDAADDARATAPDRTVELAVEGDDLVVLASPDQLRQVLANLVRNALVHTPDGTPVGLRVDRDGGDVRVVDHDRGPGLPEGAGDEIFDRFWRAEAERGRGRGPAGAGLGLAIVAGIVRAHGGTVAARDADAGGAEFEVRLPAVE